MVNFSHVEHAKSNIFVKLSDRFFGCDCELISKAECEEKIKKAGVMVLSPEKPDRAHGAMSSIMWCTVEQLQTAKAPCAGRDCGYQPCQFFTE
jgi:hypothetical protein